MWVLVVEVFGDGFFDEFADAHVSSFGFLFKSFAEVVVASEGQHRISLH